MLFVVNTHLTTADSMDSYEKIMCLGEICDGQCCPKVNYICCKNNLFCAKDITFCVDYSSSNSHLISLSAYCLLVIVHAFLDHIVVNI